MARLTVSYSIAFIPGLPRPLVLSEVIDDVVGLSTFASRHDVRKAPGTPDRLDIVVPVGDLESALDSAAKAADELTRIGESLLGLGFVVEERAIRIDGLTDNWLPETFDGAGARHHASTHLDAAAPLPDHLEEPIGDVPDEELRLDDLANLPAADEPYRPLGTATGGDDDLLDGDRFDGEPLDGEHRDGAGDRFAAPGTPDDDADLPRHLDERRFSTPRDATAPAPLDDEDDDAVSGDPRGEEPFSVDPRGTRALRSVPTGEGGERPALLLAPVGRTATLHHDELAAVVRRRDLVRRLGVVTPAPAPRGTTGKALALFALALLAAIVPWGLGTSSTAVVGLALVAGGVGAGAAALWPTARAFGARTALTGAATLAVVLAFASAYAVCAREGDLRAAHAGAGGPTVGQSLSAAVSLGAAPGLSLGPGARSVAYGERLVLLLVLAGLGAQVAARTTRRRA